MLAQIYSDVNSFSHSNGLCNAQIIQIIQYEYMLNVSYYIRGIHINSPKKNKRKQPFHPTQNPPFVQHAGPSNPALPVVVQIPHDQSLRDFHLAIDHKVSEFNNQGSPGFAIIT